MEMMAIAAKGLTIAFDGRPVVDSIDLDLPTGSVTAVIGPSGCGKSLTLRAILGLVPRAAGSIAILGQDMDADEASVLLRRRMGVLFQHGALFSSLSVLENVSYPMQEHTRFDRAALERIAHARLDMVGLPAKAADLYPSELSGGMIKRAALARALALDPEILLLDEPTAGLDPISADAFDALLNNLKEWLELSVLMVTHDLDSIGAVADRIVAMHSGSVIAQGAKHAVIGDSHPWLRSYFDGPRAARLGKE